MLKNVLAWLNLNEFNWLENKSMVKAVKLCVCVFCPQPITSESLGAHWGRPLLV
jgi:hypothetical protein